jgi:hypothetical protein
LIEGGNKIGTKGFSLPLDQCFTKERLHTGKGDGGVENMSKLSRFDGLRKRNEYFFLFTDGKRFKMDRSGFYHNAMYFDKLLFRKNH